ncbi:MAG TPA: hypothetical protein VGV12_09245 [Gemmatimonadales bacterium]|nr:hypothetical protein [Gemmatimonadales bacterium]
MSTPSVRAAEAVPLLVVTDVGARLVRRGLLAPDDGSVGHWARARVLVFRDGPVVCEPALPRRALTRSFGSPTFQPRR